MSITVLLSYDTVFLSSGILLLLKLMDGYYWQGGKAYLALFAIDGFFYDWYNALRPLQIAFKVFWLSLIEYYNKKMAYAKSH